MSGARPAYNYNLKKITEFNPALLYAFEAEISTRHVDDLKFPANGLINSVNQYEDMFNAYYYAQEVVLKFIRVKGIAAITPSLFLYWLDEIHKRIAVTVAEDIGERDMAGQYTPRQVLRWQQGFEAGEAITVRFLIERGHHFHEQVEAKSNRFFIEMEHRGVDLKPAEDYIKLLHKYVNKKIPLSKSERDSLNKADDKMSYDLLASSIKIIAAYHLSMLSDNEKQIVERIVKICCRPEVIAADMKKYAEKVIGLWQACAKQNIDEVAELCQIAFYEGTEIHPYFNCNGRTFTAVMNIITISLNQPSFLMRNPGDKSNEVSSYSAAIKHIDTTRELLKAHIRSQIIAANDGRAYADNNLSDVVQARVEMVRLLVIINKGFPKIDLNELLAEVIDYADNTPEVSNILETKNDRPIPQVDNDVSLIMINKVKDMLTLKLAELRRNKPVAVLSQVVKRQYTKDEQIEMIANLEVLTGLRGWKANTTVGMIWLEVIDSSIADHLAKALNQTNAVQAISSLNKKSRVPTVMLQSLNPEKLANVEMLDGWELSTVSARPHKAANQ